MIHRIRCAVILVKDHELLLVKHVDPFSNKQFWVPPGGGLEDQDASIFSCAAREVFEETGLEVLPDRLIYLREFIENSSAIRHLELYFTAHEFSGELTFVNVAGKGPDEDYIQQVAWLSRKDIQGLTVYPQELQENFWEEYQQGFPTVRYLGTHSLESDTDLTRVPE